MLNHSCSSQLRTCNAVIGRSLLTAALLASWPAIAAAEDGSIVAWGRNQYGQLNVPKPITDFVAVAAGYDYSLGLKSGCEPCDANCDGTVDAFDIGPFLDLLFNAGVPCNTCTGDTNADGNIDALDIEPFLNCLFP